jgi:hypothetical protein
LKGIEKGIYKDKTTIYHPTHDDYGKTIGDIVKRFFAFNCQLKKLNGESLSYLSDYRFFSSRNSSKI